MPQNKQRHAVGTSEKKDHVGSVASLTITQRLPHPQGQEGGGYAPYSQSPMEAITSTESTPKTRPEQTNSREGRVRVHSSSANEHAHHPWWIQILYRSLVSNLWHERVALATRTRCSHIIPVTMQSLTCKGARRRGSPPTRKVPQHSQICRHTSTHLHTYLTHT